MPRVRMLVSIAGERCCYQPRQVVEIGDRFGLDMIPADIARAWIAAGHAEPLELETATASAREIAAARAGGRGRA